MLPEIILPPGRYVINIPEVKGRSPELMELVRTFAKVTSDGLRDALGGVITDRENFDMDFGKRFARLGRRLQADGISAEDIQREVLDVYIHSPGRNIDPALAVDMAGAFVDKLGYSPIPKDQAA